MPAKDEVSRTPIVTGHAATALHIICHSLHMALIVFGLLGWLVPSASWLIAHLLFIPGLAIVWLINKGVCPLNNIESWLTTGRWRNPDNTEEGSFIVRVVERYLSLNPSQRQMDLITYGLMALVWALSWVHLSALEA